MMFWPFMLRTQIFGDLWCRLLPAPAQKNVAMASAKSSLPVAGLELNFCKDKWLWGKIPVAASTLVNIPKASLKGCNGVVVIIRKKKKKKKKKKKNENRYLWFWPRPSKFLNLRGLHMFRDGGRPNAKNLSFDHLQMAPWEPHPGTTSGSFSCHWLRSNEHRFKAVLASCLPMSPSKRTDFAPSKHCCSTAMPRRFFWRSLDVAFANRSENHC